MLTQYVYIHTVELDLIVQTRGVLTVYVGLCWIQTPFLRYTLGSDWVQNFTLGFIAKAPQSTHERMEAIDVR